VDTGGQAHPVLKAHAHTFEGAGSLLTEADTSRA